MTYKKHKSCILKCSSVFFNIPTKYLSEYLSNNKKQTYTQTVIYHSK